MNYQPMHIRWIYEPDEQITSYAQRLPKRPSTCNFHHDFLHTICPHPPTEQNANKKNGYDVMENFVGTMRFRDMFGRTVELSLGCLTHISETHPEIKGRTDVINETLKSPDIVKRSVYASNVLLFYKYYKYIYNGKYICIVIKILDEGCFISTAYITDKVKRGEMVWKRN